MSRGILEPLKPQLKAGNQVGSRPRWKRGAQVWSRKDAKQPVARKDRMGSNPIPGAIYFETVEIMAEFQ